MARVSAPTPYTGTVVGVEFVDGTGETSDPAALAYFRRHDAYSIDGDEQPAAPASGPVEMPKPSARKSDWLDYAVSQGMSRDDAESLTRDDLARFFTDGEG
ncbi:hypothetical protein GCM10010470_00410 [Saccharopolyspora taberi]|uniref:Uncharacterized protein n=1 Tax=Saccharopolyspora taberi TaxID=60895 RepID=A0ABN3UZS3_9PSEU